MHCMFGMFNSLCVCLKFSLRYVLSPLVLSLSLLGCAGPGAYFRRRQNITQLLTVCHSWNRVVKTLLCEEIIICASNIEGSRGVCWLSTTTQQGFRSNSRAPRNLELEQLPGLK